MSAVTHRFLVNQSFPNYPTFWKTETMKSIAIKSIAVVGGGITGVTTAYALLRHNGVEVGKRDYMGIY